MPLHLSLPQAPEGEPPRSELSPEQVPGWLASLPKDDPLGAGRMLLEQLVPFNRSRVRITLRQDVTEGVLGYVELLVPRLDAALASGTLPLSMSSRNAAALAEDLLTELAYSYKLLLVEQSRRLFGFASSGRALLPVVRAMQMLAERLKLGYRMYATNPKAVWLELHELYQFALRRGLAGRALEDGGETPLSVYRSALLVAFSEPLKLMQGDLDRVLGWLERFGHLATIGAAGQQKTGQGLFLIKSQRDVPGYALSKRHHPLPQGHDQLLNTLPLAEILLDQMARLSAGEAPESLGLTADAADPAFRDLMGRLVKHWGAVPNRRFTRLRTHARVEICVGIRGIWEFLNSRGAARADDGRVDGDQREPARLRADAREGLDGVDPRRRGDRAAHPRQPDLSHLRGALGALRQPRASRARARGARADRARSVDPQDAWRVPGHRARAVAARSAVAQSGAGHSRAPLPARHDLRAEPGRPAVETARARNATAGADRQRSARSVQRGELSRAGSNELPNWGIWKGAPPPSSFGAFSSFSSAR